MPITVRFIFRWQLVFSRVNRKEMQFAMLISFLKLFDNEYKSFLVEVVVVVVVAVVLWVANEQAEIAFKFSLIFTSTLPSPSLTTTKNREKETLDREIFCSLESFFGFVKKR